jgi:hypothetical protein
MSEELLKEIGLLSNSDKIDDLVKAKELLLLHAPKQDETTKERFLNEAGRVQSKIFELLEEGYGIDLKDIDVSGFSTVKI